MGRINMLEMELVLNETALKNDYDYNNGCYHSAELLIQRAYLKDMLIEEYRRLLYEHSVSISIAA